MTAAKDEHGNLLPDEIRLTKFGKFLRSNSLDESSRLLKVMSHNTDNARFAFERDDVAQSLIQIIDSDHQDNYCIDTVDRYSYR